ncbi:MAG TPA: cytochrome o ubiquinol oxidase subunit IV [Acetobacteraceae bacterium]|jgi:cytochrome o ubiquinol oxidase operon protein cyoD|nr:cytochrome o ubiquinol oxidase subunit IV [Acetobacteraceae bacterium]
MNDSAPDISGGGGDMTPGVSDVAQFSPRSAILGYALGLAFAIILTLVSFFIANTQLIWQPSIPVALAVLAIAQIGVHLVFFLHITTSPDNANNVLALAFGVLIVFLIVVGSVWIMGHMNDRMMPMDQIMQMQR